MIKPFGDIYLVDDNHNRIALPEITRKAKIGELGYLWLYRLIHKK